MAVVSAAVVIAIACVTILSIGSRAMAIDVALIIAVVSEGVGLVAVAVVAVFGSCLLLLLLGSGVVTYPSSGGSLGRSIPIKSKKKDEKWED